MKTEKKIIPVVCVSFVADDEKQYESQIRELKNEMGITDSCGGYNMGIRMSVVIDGEVTTLVVHREGEDYVIDVKYSEHNDEGDSGNEDYVFVGSNDDPDDELLVVACVRKY